MRRRGHVLLLVMFCVVVGVTAVTVFLTRYSIADAARRDDRARTQALWLARSACLSGFTGRRTDLSTRSGKAELVRSATGVDVTVANAHAHLDCR